MRGLFKVLLCPFSGAVGHGMGFKFLKFLQRYIQNDLDLIVSTDPNLLDELMQDCLALIKICAIVGIGPSEQIVTVSLHFFGCFL